MNPISQSEIDLQYMQEALALAEEGRGRVAPNPLVGSVLVKDGRIVGRGYHRRYGARHAEVEAIADAGRLAKGATMYVTLQPCNHFGKTPPCVDAILNAGIRRIVIAAEDPNPKSKCDDGLRRLKEAGVKVKTGVARTQAMKQNEVHLHNVKYQRPFVALKLAATLDAKIADFQGKSQWITSEPSRDYVHRLRGEFASILVGSRTVQTDNPRLTCRVRGRKNPLRVVLDPDLSLPTKALVFNQPGRVIVFTSRKAVAARKKPFERKHIDVIEVDEDHDGLLIWTQVLDHLYQQEIASVLVEGGSRVAASALQAGIVNKVYLFLAPMILGGGITYSDELVPRRLEQAIRLKDWISTPIGDDLLIEGYPDTEPVKSEVTK